MRRKIIGTKDFQGAVDVTDPCYSRNVWCRMNNISIKKACIPVLLGIIPKSFR